MLSVKNVLRPCCQSTVFYNYFTKMLILLLKTQELFLMNYICMVIDRFNKTAVLAVTLWQLMPVW